MLDGVAIAIFFLFFPVQAGSFVYTLPLVSIPWGTRNFLSYLSPSYNKNTGLQPVRLILVGVGFSLSLSGLMIVLISSATCQS